MVGCMQRRRLQIRTHLGEPHLGSFYSNTPLGDHGLEQHYSLYPTYTTIPHCTLNTPLGDHGLEQHYSLHPTYTTIPLIRPLAIMAWNSTVTLTGIT